MAFTPTRFGKEATGNVNTPYTFRLATEADRQLIVDFMNTHWEIRHPLINLPDFFDFYYNAPKGKLNFALAFGPKGIAAIAGFIPANSLPKPDIWVSIWVADKAASGSGLELMAALPGLTNCRTLACNNIRPKTRPFYEFLGFTTGRVGHYYRLAQRGSYAVAQPAAPQILPVAGSATLQLLPTAQALQNSGFAPPQSANPYKDIAYITKRYYAYPRQTYNVWGAFAPQGGGVPQALLVTRTVPVLGTYVVRIADYIGEPKFLPELGCAIQNLLCGQNAEYIDFYCAGLPDALLAQTGFSVRCEGDETIIPNYLEPPLFENTEYYYFTNRPAGFALFRADGDQDRPNVQV